MLTVDCLSTIVREIRSLWPQDSSAGRKETDTNDTNRSAGAKSSAMRRAKQGGRIKRTGASFTRVAWEVPERGHLSEA